MRSALLTLVVVWLKSSNAQKSLPLNITINSSTPLNTVAPEYISANFDWHLDTEEGWVNASVMKWRSNGFIDLNDPRVCGGLS
jgi:hypothetical protein